MADHAHSITVSVQARLPGLAKYHSHRLINQLMIILTE